LTTPEKRQGTVLNGIRLPGSAGKPEVQENRRFRLLKLFTGCRLRLPQYKTFRKSEIKTERSLFKVTSGFELVSSGNWECHKNQGIGGDIEALRMVNKVEKRNQNGYNHATAGERKV